MVDSGAKRSAFYTFKDIEEKDINKVGNFLNRHSLFPKLDIVGQ